MKLILATTNKHKAKEINEIMSKHGYKIITKKIRLIEPDFDTLEEIAKYKAIQAYEKLKKPVITEDTGVYFCEYKNFPGVHAKRIFESIGFKGLITLIKTAKNKKAYFKTTIVYYNGKISKTFSGKLEGTLLEKPVSIKKDRLPYEKIFVPKGQKKALVDLSLEQKNKISHRAKATKKMLKWLKKIKSAMGKN
ncbi:MAG: non-canonical purine NTP pyrophosphatase [Candidatus Diapherotrites archaeon]